MYYVIGIVCLFLPSVLTIILGKTVFRWMPFCICLLGLIYSVYVFLTVDGFEAFGVGIFFMYFLIQVILTLRYAIIAQKENKKQ